MSFLGTPFCDVAAETYPLTLYGGGWGIPAAGIDNIEPAPVRRRCCGTRVWRHG